MTVPTGIPERPKRSAHEVRQIVLAVVIVVLVAAVLMAACGNRDGTSGAATATGTGSASAGTPAATEVTPTDGAASPPSTATSAPLTTADTTPNADSGEATQDGTLPASAAALTATQPLTANGAPTATAALTASESVTTPATALQTCAIETSAELAGYSALTERLGCPTAESTVEPVAINEFGPGPAYTRFMLWFGNEQQIYVLQPDGAWLAYTDTWSDSDPEILCNPDDLDPATSPPLPRRGFGKLWCTVEAVQEAMGPIDREERLCQHAVVQRFDKGRLLACFEDATIRYFRLLEDGTWDIEMVQ